MNKEQDLNDETLQARKSRRDFIITSAIAAASVGASAFINAQSAQAAEPKSRITYGNGPYPVEGMAAYAPTGNLRRMKFQRRALGPKDVAIKLYYCGVCHSDIHTVRGDWGKVQYPLVVGHELAGEVVAIGSSAGKYKVGSRVGVGCMVNSCRHCPECLAGFEQFCENSNTQTYASKDRDGSITQGGYSTFVVVDEDFVISVPDSIDLADAGPMMCAGITVYSPLRHWNVGPGKKIAVSGMGGLGHMGVKIATAMGADVTVITTSPDKEQDARRFGATNVIHNKAGADLSKYKKSFDFVLDTVPYTYELDRITPLLKRDAVICRVGVGRLTEPNEFGQMTLVGARNAIAGSNTGGIRETQEMIDFCALHNIKPQITKISMSGIDQAWEQVVSKKARYRFVVDMNA
ncbi:MAG: NAD(P)-dependent alcohol dehydrogenase [Methylophilaceae bacterium]